jgi:hypothetical protein
VIKWNVTLWAVPSSKLIPSSWPGRQRSVRSNQSNNGKDIRNVVLLLEEGEITVKLNI